MFNFGYITKEDIKEHNPNRTINYWRCWILKNKYIT